jgi:NADH-quinone oxidoreductase subunit M
MITPVSFWHETPGFPILGTMTLLPLAGMLAVRCLCAPLWKNVASMGAAFANVLLTIGLLVEFDGSKTGIQFAEQFSLWGMSYSVGVDGLNILFLALTTIVGLLALIYIDGTRKAGNGHYINVILAYESILIAAFCALNLLQFWVILIIELMPFGFLLKQSAWNRNSRFLAIRLVQYFGSSLLMLLAGFLLLAFGLVDSEHELTFDLLTLKNNHAYLHDETLIFILLFYGFAIRMPLFPFHGWLPLLAGQSSLVCLTMFVTGLKLGVYGVIRFILPLVPGVAEQWAGFVLVLCLISIFYGALLAFMQNNLYRLLAFAVVSHTGALVFGIFSFNKEGLEGTLLLSLVYGLAMLGKFVSSSLIHEDTGTAMIPRLGNLFDSHVTLGLLFLITALSTMIKPGSLGFDAGHLLLEGLVEEHEWLVASTILVGNVMAAGFLLWAFQRIFLAKSQRFKKYTHSGRSVLQERIITAVICGIHIATGLNSFYLFNLVNRDVAELVSEYPMHSSDQDNSDKPQDGASNNDAWPQNSPDGDQSE